MIFLSVASRTLTNPLINNHPTLHTTHYTPASALGGVAPPCGGETCDRSCSFEPNSTKATSCQVSYIDFALTGFAQDDTSQGSMSRACSASSTRPGPWLTLGDPRLRGDDKLGPGNAHKKTDLGYRPYIPEYMKWGVCFFVQRKVYFGRGKKIYIDDGGHYGNDNGPA